MVAPTNIRFAEPTQESLTRFVRRTGQTKSSVINTAVEEWLRMQAAMKHLPELMKKLRAMEKKLAKYEEK